MLAAGGGFHSEKEGWSLSSLAIRHTVNQRISGDCEQGGVGVAHKHPTADIMLELVTGSG